MTVLSVFKRLFLAAPIALLLSGCTPMGSSPGDETKDPYFLSGQSRAMSLDFDGAIAAYENALIANPRSAAAHKEIGFLYEEKRTNYAAAIYHFERHLELCPKSNVSEPIRQHILACKVELAKTVPFAMITRQVQDDFRRLNSSNTLLAEQVKMLKTELVEQAAQCSNRLALATQMATLRQQTAPSSYEPEKRPAPVEKRSTPPERVSTYQGSDPPPRSTISAKTYQVRPGETLAIISRRQNIRLSSLLAANPGIDSRKLKAGQVIHLP